MCKCVFLASDHPFPVIPLVREQPAFVHAAITRYCALPLWLPKNKR